MRHLFEFTLDPIEHIQPWGEPPNQALHWFGLSSGSYWLDLGVARLLEYLPRAGWPLHVDYELARLHEDVLGILPEVFEPVPADVIARFPEGSIIRADRRLLELWEPFDKAPGDLDLAREKVCARYLDTAYLRPGACIWFWSDADNVIVEWDNRHRLKHGEPVWSAPQGRHEIDRAAFLHEVRSFDSRLMAAMGERVERAATHWPRPDVKLDVQQLRQEHVLRTTSLDSALRRPPKDPSLWDLVRAELSLAGDAG